MGSTSNFGADADGQSDVANPTTFTGRRYDPESGLYYFRNRMYHAQVGVFISRDLIRYVSGMCMYASIFVPQHTDPLGLVPNRCDNIYTMFMRWYTDDEEAGNGWLEGLPACPCSLPSHTEKRYRWFLCFQWGHHEVTVFDNPDPNLWEPPKPASQYHHPTASNCIRSKNANTSGAGQQCCYDGAGLLITNGPGAGTPDRHAPIGTAVGRHWFEDVGAYDFAISLDRECQHFGPLGNYDSFLEMYLERRPPNPGDNGSGQPCKKNP